LDSQSHHSSGGISMNGSNSVPVQPHQSPNSLPWSRSPCPLQPTVSSSYYNPVLAVQRSTDPFSQQQQQLRHPSQLQDYQQQPSYLYHSNCLESPQQRIPASVNKNGINYFLSPSLPNQLSPLIPLQQQSYHQSVELYQIQSDQTLCQEATGMTSNHHQRYHSELQTQLHHQIGTQFSLNSSSQSMDPVSTVSTVSASSSSPSSCSSPSYQSSPSSVSSSSAHQNRRSKSTKSFNLDLEEDFPSLSCNSSTSAPPVDPPAVLTTNHISQLLTSEVANYQQDDESDNSMLISPVPRSSQPQSQQSSANNWSTHLLQRLKQPESRMNRSSPGPPQSQAQPQASHPLHNKDRKNGVVVASAPSSPPRSKPSQAKQSNQQKKDQWTEISGGRRRKK